MRHLIRSILVRRRISGTADGPVTARLGSPNGTMPKATDVNDLILAIYDAGMDFRLWPVVLERIATAFGVPSVGVARQGKTPAECWAFTIGLDPSFSQKYVDHYHTVNLIWQRSNSTPAGTVQSDSMIVPRRELSKTEFFNDFLLPQQTRGLLNAVVLCEEGRQSVITLQADRQIEEHEVDFYKLLTRTSDERLKSTSSWQKQTCNNRPPLRPSTELMAG